MVIMTSRYRIVTNTATQTATIVSESPILAWYQVRIGDSDTIVTGLPTLDTIVAHNCQSVNRLDTIVTHNCNDAVWVGPEATRQKTGYPRNAHDTDDTDCPTTRCRTRVDHTHARARLAPQISKLGLSTLACV